MKTTWFLLTNEQIEALNPLWDEGIEDNKKNEQGAILLQPIWAGLDVEVKGQYMPKEVAERINRIIEEYNTKLAIQAQGGYLLPTLPKEI